MAEVYVSQSEFARRVGLTRQRISLLVRKGHLPSNASNQVPLEEGLRALEARRATNQAVQMLQSAQSPGVKKKAKPKATPPSDSDPDDGSDESASVMFELNKAKRDLTKAQARLKEFEQLEREGQLVETAVVEQEGAALGALVREWMSSAPSRYSGYLEMKTQREAELELRRMMQDLNKLFQSSQYTKEATE